MAPSKKVLVCVEVSWEKIILSNTDVNISGNGVVASVTRLTGRFKCCFTRLAAASASY